MYVCVCVCLFVCVFIRVFLGHLGSDLDTLWYKVGFRARKGSKTIKLKKIYFPQSYCPFLFL